MTAARTIAFGLFLAAMSPAAGAVAQEDVPVPPIGPDQLAFSTENMDLSADPRADFYRYASGKWLDRAVRPPQLATIGIFDYMGERLKAQMVNAITDASADDRAAKGSPTQQVGDFYASYMDVAAIDARGMAPLQQELAKVDAIASLDDLADYMVHYVMITGDASLLNIVPSADRADSTKYVLYAVSGDLGLTQGPLYDEPVDSPRMQAYRTFLEDVLKIAGYDEANAAMVAGLTVALEHELHAIKIAPVDMVDPRNTYHPMPLADLQAEIPNLDLTRLITGLGLPVTDTVVRTEPNFVAGFSKILSDHPIEDFRNYFKVRLIMKFMAVLSTRFDEPILEINRSLAGITALAPREQRAQDLMRVSMGHPLSQVYVDRFFSDETRQQATDMIGRIKAVFTKRMEAATWLAPETKAAALEKLQALVFRVGYPDIWVDYSGVDIRRDDPLGNLIRLNQFSVQNDVDKFGGPVVHDQFNSSKATLPIIINAAYSTQINGFEVPAAMLQPAAFDPAMPAAVNFCRLGAVLGHEMTHGFDSGGRMFDASGNLRDWWTPEDSAAFEKEAQKLIDQADQFEMLPGLKGNGRLEVKENMADVGGINFAYEALMDYLREHPEEATSLGGLTPAQQCFIAWTQMWTMKASDQAIERQVTTDYHPPSFYRATAALKHVDGFYEAFDITEGDPMWLPPEKRVHAW